MTAKMRVIDTGLRPARWNVAMTAALAELRRSGRIDDTLRFHRYPQAVLIGRHQVLADAVDGEQCRDAGVEIARRFTGGGAVYMAHGALAWDIVLGRSSLRHEQLAEAICRSIAESLASLGLPAQCRPPNDIVVGERKICGGSGYFDGEVTVYQATILVDATLGDMLRFLQFPVPPTQRDLAQRVATVTELIGRAPAAGEIEDCVTRGVMQALNAVAHRAAPAHDELKLADAYLDGAFGSDRSVEEIDVQEFAVVSAARTGPERLEYVGAS